MWGNDVGRRDHRFKGFLGTETRRGGGLLPQAIERLRDLLQVLLRLHARLLLGQDGGTALRTYSYDVGDPFGC